MSSKINGVEGSRRTVVGAGGAAPRPQDAGSGAAQATGAAASVHITDTATQLAALELTLGDLPVVNEARVSQLSSAIDQGTYQIVPQQIADRLLQLEQALGSLPAPQDGDHT